MWSLKHSPALLAAAAVGLIGCAGAGDIEGKLPGAGAEAVAPAPPAGSPSLAPHRNMTAARATHTATLLPDGKVLLAGGMQTNDLILASAELYDPSTGRFTPAGDMRATRGGHAAVALRDRRVLLVGGFDGSRGVSSAELYDPESNTFTATGGMSKGRASLAATLLDDGTVLVSGGNENRRDVLASAEVYDPRAGRFSPAGEMSTVRYKHSSTLLPGGKVLVSGGSDARDGRGRKASAEIYDPARRAFTAAGGMSAPRYKHTPGALSLRDGRVLVAGGNDRVEIYDPRTNSFKAVGGGLGADYLFTTATLLPDGRVLIAGGYGHGTRSGGPSATGSTWIYQP
jgi:Galactose oxidase, central domain/Kelch motif